MRSALMRVGCIVAAMALCGLAKANEADKPWSWRMPKEEQVAFRGVASFDHAGAGQYPMLYPGGHALVFLAAVLTHSAVAQSAKDSQKAQMQQEADKVLEPLQPVVGALTHRELMQRALQQDPSLPVRGLLDPDTLPPAGGLIDSAAVFSMTQDRRALVLDHAFALQRAGDAAPSYRNTVRVVSAPSSEQDLVAYWGADNGERLRAHAASMLAESLRIALADEAARDAQSTLPQRTYRYPEGGAEKIERAQLVSQRCDRLVLKTLRGWLLSVPRRAVEGSGCPPEASLSADAAQ